MVMLAHNFSDYADKIDLILGDVERPVYIQPKLDGVRGILNSKEFLTRKDGHILSMRHIQKGLKFFFEQYPELTLDGEIYTHGLPFDEISGKARKTNEQYPEIHYHIFDVMGMDKGYSERMKIVEQFSDQLPEFIHIVPRQRVGNLHDICSECNHYIKQGYEGSIVRIDHYPYQQGKRHYSLLKYKSFESKEVTLKGFLPSKGMWAMTAKRAIIIETVVNKFGHSIEVEHVVNVSGDRETLRTVYLNSRQYIGKKATVVFGGRTPKGKMRFPVLKDLDRWDI